MQAIASSSTPSAVASLRRWTESQLQAGDQAIATAQASAVGKERKRRATRSVVAPIRLHQTAWITPRAVRSAPRASGTASSTETSGGRIAMTGTGGSASR